MYLVIKHCFPRNHTLSTICEHTDWSVIDPWKVEVIECVQTPNHVSNTVWILTTHSNFVPVTHYLLKPDRVGINFAVFLVLRIFSMNGNSGGTRESLPQIDLAVNGSKPRGGCECPCYPLLPHCWNIWEFRRAGSPNKNKNRVQGPPIKVGKILLFEPFKKTKWQSEHSDHISLSKKNTAKWRGCGFWKPKNKHKT